MTIKHEVLVEQVFGEGDGVIYAVQESLPQFPIFVAFTGAINPDYINVVAASGLMYRMLEHTKTYLERMIELMDDVGQDAISNSLGDIQASINTTLKVAIEGRRNIPK